MAAVFTSLSIFLSFVLLFVTPLTFSYLLKDDLYKLLWDLYTFQILFALTVIYSVWKH